MSESGLLVVDVAAADDETAFALHADPASRWQRRPSSPQLGMPASPVYGCAATSTCASPWTCPVVPAGTVRTLEARRTWARRAQAATKYRH